MKWNNFKSCRLKSVLPCATNTAATNVLMLKHQATGISPLCQCLQNTKVSHNTLGYVFRKLVGHCDLASTAECRPIWPPEWRFCFDLGQRQLQNETREIQVLSFVAAYIRGLTVITTVYPNKYAHGFCFAMLCCGYKLTDFPISIRLTSLAVAI